MDLKSALAVAANVGWFAERSAKTRATLSRIARLQKYETGQAIYRVGDPPNGLFGLIAGSIEISIPRADGMDFIIYKADPGYWIGDLAQFSGQSRLVTLVASAPTHVLNLPESDLQRLLKDDPHLYADFYQLNHINTSLALRLLATIAVPPSDERIAIRLLMQNRAGKETGDTMHLSQSKLAEMVALSVPTVERVLRRFQELGLVDIGYGRIRILDRDRLALTVAHRSQD